MLRIACLVFLLLFSLPCSAQTPDSVKRVKLVEISAPFLRSTLLQSTASIGILDSAELEKHSSGSLVSSMNTIAGVRMEERSPGSYRLSVRGSLLRSPFGIRNLKVYADEFSLTDAGGNTYLNLLDAGAATIEILKGPASSIFGANTGGAVLLGFPSQGNRVTLETGSFGTLRQQAMVNQAFGKARLGLNAAYQHADGYREQSTLDRKYFQFIPRWAYKHGAARALLIYADLHYETPGGLTENQVAVNPRAARSSTGTLPGAIEQKAAIYNESFFAGLANDYYINNNWKHVVAVQYMYTDLKNPFITNFETRKERTLGIRSYLSYSSMQQPLPFGFDVGIEASHTSTEVDNSANNLGERGMLMAADRLNAQQFFLFVRATKKLTSELFAEASGSLNFYGYDYTSVFPVYVAKQTKKLSREIMPRLALSYRPFAGFAIRASASRGYSPPTIAEVRASDRQVNTSLQAEHGMNYELGFRLDYERCVVDLSAFSFNLNDAIVRKVNTNDTEYSTNAGGTKQRGMEAQARYDILPETDRTFLRKLSVSITYTYSHFHFSKYYSAGQDLNGNALTGVPGHVFQTALDAAFSRRISLFFQYARTSSIWLNDSNTVSARPYNLAEAKITWKLLAKARLSLVAFAGADNIFNASYSLGNDLNAAGGRFFNPAPPRNYYGGIKLSFD